MSIIGLIGILAASQEIWIGLLTWIATAVALGIFIKFRAYRPRSIGGTPRLPDEEPLGPFFLIFIGGLSLWLMTQALTLKFMHRGVPLDQIKPTQFDTVLVGIVAGIVPLGFMLLGTFTRRKRGLQTLG